MPIKVKGHTLNSDNILEHTEHKNGYYRPLIGTILTRDAMHSADYAVVRCPSVCLAVRPSHGVCIHQSFLFYNH